MEYIKAGSGLLCVPLLTNIALNVIFLLSVVDCTIELSDGGQGEYYLALFISPFKHRHINSLTWFTSLSPLPERLTITVEPFLALRAKTSKYAMAWDVSSAGIIPSS